MLVLSRGKDESVICGEGENAIVITVVDIRGDRVRLGFQANPAIPIHRQEVFEAIQRENLRSAGLDPDADKTPSPFPNRRASRSISSEEINGAD